MLVDSHCHHDFPDFADELDAVVDRARAVDISRIVTISTRVAKHADLIDIAERFPEVFCSIGTHPHNAHEELDITAADLVARARHPKVVALGEAGLDHHYDYSPRDAQERGFRTHIAAARESGLPLVIHAREADADMTRILEEETRLGAFPAVLHCYTGGRDLAMRAIDLRHPDLQEIGRPARDRGRAAARPHHGRNRCALSGARQVAGQAQRAVLCGGDRESAGASARHILR